MTDESKNKPKWTTRRKLLIALVILIGIPIVVILPGVFWELYEANRAIHGFSDALIAKQYERAYEFTAPELRAVTDYPTFVKAHEGLTLRMGDLKSVEVNQSEVKDKSEGWYGTADINMIFTRGSLPFVFVLKKENHSWQIYSYREQ
jgi:hypothetical protein